MCENKSKYILISEKLVPGVDQDQKRTPAEFPFKKIKKFKLFSLLTPRKGKKLKK